jgi:NH3-dependent NAD+ synthetase
MTSFDDASSLVKPFRRIPFVLAESMEGLKREVPGMPFVPAEGPELHRRCAEIFGIQCAGLAKRIEQLPAGTPLNIGISGGLDSTLALLVAVTTCDTLGLDRRLVHGLTMPGFGTTQRTRTNAISLMEQLGASAETIDISALALEAFQEMGHAPFGIAARGLTVDSFRAALARVPKESRCDLTFENVQARLRTFLLMSKGFVVGTGDLSELALGWSTYNADHMSMYNPNCSIPKTLVKFLVRYVAMHQFPEGPVRRTLLSIVETTISPELLPASQCDEIEQSTEATLGPYELLDFVLYHAVRCGYSPAKILFMSQFATFTQPFARGLRAGDAHVLYAVFPPAVQAVVHTGWSQGGHGQPFAPRRLADALRRRPRRVAALVTRRIGLDPPLSRAWRKRRSGSTRPEATSGDSRKLEPPFMAPVRKPIRRLPPPDERMERDHDPRRDQFAVGRAILLSHVAVARQVEAQSFPGRIR